MSKLIFCCCVVPCWTICVACCTHCSLFQSTNDERLLHRGKGEEPPKMHYHCPVELCRYAKGSERFFSSFGLLKQVRFVSGYVSLVTIYEAFAAFTPKYGVGLPNFLARQSDYLIFRASSEIVKHQFAFCPQHRACRLNDKFTFDQSINDGE